MTPDERGYRKHLIRNHGRSRGTCACLPAICTCNAQLQPHRYLKGVCPK